MARDSFWERPQPGRMPTRAWVSAKRELKATGDGHAIDRADDRAGEATDGGDGILVADGAANGARARTEFLEVEAGAKCLARPRQNDGLNLWIGFQFLEGPRDGGAQFTRQRVHGGGAIEGGEGDSA